MTAIGVPVIPVVGIPEVIILGISGITTSPCSAAGHQQQHSHKNYQRPGNKFFHFHRSALGLFLLPGMGPATIWRNPLIKSEYLFLPNVYVNHSPP